MFSRWRERLHHTLGIRIAIWYALFFLSSSLGLIVVTYALLAITLRHYDREIIQTTLVQFAGAYARGGRPALERELLRAQAVAHGPLFVRAVGARRDLIFVSMPDAWRGFDLSQLAAPPLAGEQTWATLQTGPGGPVLEVASVRLPDDTLFQVGMSTERRNDLLGRFRLVLLVNFAAIALIGLAGGALLTRSALRPLRTLTDTVREIMRTGRTDARVPAAREDDALGELSLLVNAMLDRIDAVVAGMRGAVDNVAHDLRTPLTRLRAIAESALQSGKPEVMAEALADCLEEADRVSAMLNTLMDISEAETGTMALTLAPVNLSEVVRDAIDLYEDMADARGQTIEVTTDDQPIIRGDRNRLRQVVANLIDNAVKYTPAGGRIQIEARRDGAGALLAVTDTGPASSRPTCRASGIASTGAIRAARSAASASA
jgi:signal transduction histidine kinase